MTVEEISKAAANNEPCPDNLSQSETMLFESLRCLYQSFLGGCVSREQAVKERKQIINLYRQNHISEQLWKCHAKRYQRVLKLEPQISSGDCEMCKRVIGILDGTIQE